MEYPIDFIITWVDGNDPIWQNERAKYVGENEAKKKDVAGKERYQDNGLLRYLFRGIEEFAPWVHKVYFVTYGHLPEWLNKECEKLVIVNHKDFMPSEYLPTFSSVPLNLNLFRIPELSEHFVYFNDDMFLVSPVDTNVFFRNGLPCDMAVQDVIPATEASAYWHMVMNDIIILNKNVCKRRCIREFWSKWINVGYGKNMIKNLLLSPLSMFTGIYETHLPAGYLKSVYIEMWEKNRRLFDEVSHHKVRTPMDVSENCIRYYQLGTGRFSPINKLKYGRYCTMNPNVVDNLIKSKKYKYLCINDVGSDIDISGTVRIFDELLPSKCSFEK